LGPACPNAGETCQLSGNGCPKYGDYNGNACIAGRIFNAWASATAPPGLPPVGGVTQFFSAIRAPLLSVKMTTTPKTDPGSFDLQIDGVTKARNVHQVGSTGTQVMSFGVHRVGETGARGTSLANYAVVIGGDCAPDGSITLGPNDNKKCSITNRRLPTTACQSKCRRDLADCRAAHRLPERVCLQNAADCESRCSGP
jgi:hypothetical protein